MSKSSFVLCIIEKTRDDAQFCMMVLDNENKYCQQCFNCRHEKRGRLFCRMINMHDSFDSKMYSRPSIILNQ